MNAPTTTAALDGPGASRDDAVPAVVAAFGATLCMLVGWHWDISWHRSIGRDTVWTPAHIAIYVALALAFGSCAVLVLRHTFGDLKERAGITVWRFRGPAGAFVALWAILFQFAGILFDDWWHEVYGLDIAIATPPHNVIGVSNSIFYFGLIVLAASYLRGSAPGARRLIRALCLGMVACLVGHFEIGMDPAYGPLALRSWVFLVSGAVVLPFALVLVQTWLDWKWAGVVTAAAYVATTITLMQIFPVFEATPQFGPVFHRVEFLLPPPFPVLLVVPAAAIAPLVARSPNPGVRGWLLVGAAFVVTFTVTNWVMSGLISSPFGHNGFFAGGYPGSAFRAEFRESVPLGLDPVSIAAIAGGTVAAALSAKSGSATGLWLRNLAR